VGGLFLALAGLILTSRVHSGQPNLQPTLAFEAIAACAIGGLPLTGGAGRASGVLVGVLVITITQNGLRLLNWPSQLQLIAIGVLTIVAVLAQRAWPNRSGARE
jgi:ribose/xylose/arabinose/galactoside ABC-type transport system permease subunit